MWKHAGCLLNPLSFFFFCLSVWRDDCFLVSKHLDPARLSPPPAGTFPSPQDSPLCADVLLLDRHAGHLPQPDPHLDVPELQAQVLPQDGDSGSPLPWARLWEQLDEDEEEGEDQEEAEDQEKVRRRTLC